MEGSGKRKAEIIEGLESKRKSTRTRTIKRNRKRGVNMEQPSKAWGGLLINNIINNYIINNYIII